MSASDCPQFPPARGFAVGIDLVENARIASLLERAGEAFVRRTFTAAEAEYCRRHRNPAPRFAARFAAKEAVAKALGTGIGEACAFVEIEVVHTTSGSPAVRLHGKAAETAASLGITGLSLSLTHADTHSAAMVVAGRSTETDR